MVLSRSTRMLLSALVLGVVMIPAFGAGGSFRKTASTENDPIHDELRMAMKESLVMAHADSLGIESIGQKLAGTWRAMEKTQDGLLTRSAVQYIAHSYFLHEHAWNIQGLDPHRSHKTQKGPGDWDDVAGFFLNILEGKNGHRGLKVNAVVAFIALQRNLILREGYRRLKVAYKLNRFATNSRLTLPELERVLDSYMVLHQNGDMHNVTQHKLDTARLHQTWSRGFPELQTFTVDMMRNMIFLRTPALNPFREPTFSIDDGMQAAADISKEYGKVRNVQCQVLKEGLIDMDARDSGRVPLKKFYAKKSIGPWGLRESAVYLRQLGALDESSPSLGPQVIIPNYVSAISNCDHPSELFSICCMHECEGLLKTLEMEIQAPTAKPDRILDVVANMSSDSVEAVNLTSGLTQALWQVAEFHNGEVPLHGRLFAQWLHFTFPHECSYPYMSGAIKPLTPSEWVSKTGHGTQASEAEMAKAMRAKFDDSVATNETYMSQWTFDEEDLTSLDTASAVDKGSSWTWRSVFQIVPLLLGPITFFIGIMRSLARMGKSTVFNSKLKGSL